MEAGRRNIVGGSSAEELRLRESWSANADAWTEAVREGRIESRRLGTDAALLEAITSRPPGRLLDVGCGEGWLARALAPRGFEVVGIDGSRELVDAAARLGGGAFHVLGYDGLVEDRDAVAGPFDYAVCNFSLLSEDIVPVLLALVDRMAPGGELIVQTVHPLTAAGTDPYRDGWREEAFAAFGGGFRSAMPWFYRTMGSWIGALREARLGLEECVEPLHPESGRPLSLLLVARPDRR